jgi:hypothetical protein
MLEAAKQMPAVVMRLRLECFGAGVGCRGDIATQRVRRSFRFIDEEYKARDITIRGQC